MDKGTINYYMFIGLQAAIASLDADNIHTAISKESEDFKAGYALAIMALKDMAETLKEDDNEKETSDGIYC